MVLQPSVSSHVFIVIVWYSQLFLHPGHCFPSASLIAPLHTCYPSVIYLTCSHSSYLLFQCMFCSVFLFHSQVLLFVTLSLFVLSHPLSQTLYDIFNFCRIISFLLSVSETVFQVFHCRNYLTKLKCLNLKHGCKQTVYFFYLMF